MKRDRGFTVLELLVALTVVMLLAGALASAVPSTRQAFDRVPAELDQQQRGRSAIDAIAQTVRAATSISDDGDPETLTVTVPIANGGQGALATEQSGVLLDLAATPCPDTGVCGFTAGTTVVISDSIGRYDVFTVAATDAVAHQLTANRALGSYPAGSAIVEIERYTYRLAVQADGSYSLIRETAAGAVQPMVDFVTALSFTISGNLVEVSLSVEAATAPLRRVLSDRIFKTAIRMRNLS